MSEIDMDPRGEYYRECPYCKLQFTANHINREYCPSKNGKKDWCKNRYKRLVLNGETENDIFSNKAKIRINLKNIRNILNGDRTTIVARQVLDKVNYHFDAFTMVTPRNKLNFYSVIIENYSIELDSIENKRTYYLIRNLNN
jgi:glutamine synthetase type III